MHPYKTGKWIFKSTTAGIAYPFTLFKPLPLFSQNIHSLFLKHSCGTEHEGVSWQCTFSAYPLHRSQASDQQSGDGVVGFGRYYCLNKLCIYDLES